MINKNNIILIGALTSKPYAFKARSWELKNIETIDLFDSMCSNIRVDLRGSNIMRILPATNETLNEEWISDKARFAFDGLKRNRFLNPMIKKDGLFVQSSWKNAFSFIEKKISNSKFDNVIIKTGNFTSFEDLVVLEELSNKFKNVQINPSKNFNNDLQNYYTFNNENLNKEGPKVFLLVGVNLRLENPMLNIKLRKLSQKKDVLIAYIGPKYNYNINLLHLGNDINILNNIISGKHKFSTLISNFMKKNGKNHKISERFKNNVSVIFGNDFKLLANSSKMISNLSKSKNKNINFELGVLDAYTGKINNSELGFASKSKKIKGKCLHILLNAETSDKINAGDFVIYLGTHNEKIRTKFDVILPGFTWLEKSNLYMNCYGIIQKSHIALGAPINAREDWKILKMLSLWLENSKSLIIKTGKEDNINNINDVHRRLNELSPNLMNSISNYKINNIPKLNFVYNKKFKNKMVSNSINMKSFISNYYNLTSIEKNSKIMKECTNTINKKNNFFKN